MASNKLSDTECKKAKAKEKNYSLSDGDGLSLEVPSIDSKRWRFRYRFDGKAKLKSLGLYPEITLSKARELRNEARTNIANGINPFPSKQSKQVQEALQLQEKTFKQWSEYYLDKVKDDVTETHLVRTLKGWKKDVYPIIGELPMNDIKARDIISILHIMAERGAIESSKKVFSSISRCFQVCIANFPDDIERNPTKDINLSDVVGKRKKTHYPIITDAKELGSLLNSIDKMTGHISTKLALKMIANTFVRPLNIRMAEWSEINIKEAKWTIPPTKMKTKKELIVPLSKQMLKLLNQAMKYSKDSIYIFPSMRSNTSPMSDGTLVAGLRRIGYSREEIVAHSFRGIFSTVAHEKNEYSHEVIETQLAHSVGNSVSQAYNRSVHLEERTNMMQWYSDLLEEYQKQAKKK